MPPEAHQPKTSRNAARRWRTAGGLALLVLVCASLLTAGLWTGSDPTMPSNPENPRPAAASAQPADAPQLAPDRPRATVTATAAPLSQPQAARPAVLAPTPGELVARDHQREAALRPFEATLLSGIDGCLAAGSGPRSPQRLALQFVPAGPAADGVEPFRLAALMPVAADPSRPSPQQQPGWSCFSALVGRTVTVPAGTSPHASGFQYIVTLPLPKSVGWELSAGAARPPTAQP